VLSTNLSPDLKDNEVSRHRKILAGKFKWYETRYVCFTPCLVILAGLSRNRTCWLKLVMITWFWNIERFWGMEVLVTPDGCSPFVDVSYAILCSIFSSTIKSILKVLRHNYNRYQNLLPPEQFKNQPYLPRRLYLPELVSLHPRDYIATLRPTFDIPTHVMIQNHCDNSF
jgi:hypothetical protein